ncbi:hypothetical protein COV20_03425 [Candidatus Woesearchaeota archaeon CG10_big_fil_rev_8_21_14_0_10_45_16]|nr:MAG: hypothetical protein COV20_03425 [Candidatus Woesearchaeota archaeon CG10_big_fil_rev_8_21_14_0_10_45_16]
MKKNSILTAIIILSIVGLAVSGYLIENHYASPTQGSVCDLGETISCSLVNTSVFSEIFHVPVALFGAIWFFILLGLSWKGRGKSPAYVTAILWWNILGILSVIYLISAEIILQSICPFCTIVHVIVLTTLTLSILLYKDQKKKVSLEKTIESLKTWVGLILILNLLPLLFFNISFSPDENHDALAKCLTEKGVVMYGSFRCGVCAKTREMFGESFQYVKEIECHPQGEDSETELCLSKNIEGTPTWVLEIDGVEQKRYAGFLTIDELKDFSGCTE